MVMDASESTRLVRSVTLIGCKVEVQDAPLPMDLAEDHVEVRVSHCGLNFTDNYQRLGIILNQDYHVHMGSECAGTVVRFGSKVTNLQMQGGLSRHVVQVPRNNCFLLPDRISCETAVAVGLNLLMAHLCLFEFGRLSSKQTIFMQSIGGSNSSAKYPKTTLWGTRSTWSAKRLSPVDIIARNHAIAGLNVGDYLENDRDKVRSIFDHVFQLCNVGTVKPRIYSVMDFERAGDALAQLWRRENLGKVLLSVRQDSPPEDAPAGFSGVGPGASSQLQGGCQQQVQ